MIKFNKSFIFNLGFVFSFIGFVTLLTVPVIQMPLSNPLYFSLFQIMFGDTITYMGLSFQIFVFSFLILIIPILWVIFMVVIIYIKDKLIKHKFLFICMIVAEFFLSMMILNITYFIQEGPDFSNFEIVSGLAFGSISIHISYGGIISSLFLLVSSVFYGILLFKLLANPKRH
ncbi:MAG: hypothetical protein WCR19_06300 [Acholeplasmataceae bacterium]